MPLDAVRSLWITKAVPAVTALVVTMTAFSQPPPGDLAGRYSSLRMDEESGNVVGVEMVVLRGGGGLSAVVRGGEGAPGAPLVVRLDVSGNDIEFAVPTACSCGLQAGRYRGTVSEAGVTLNGPSSFGQRFLPRSGYLRSR